VYCDYELGIVRGFLQNAVCHRRPHPPSLPTWASAFFQDPLRHACQPTKWGSTVIVITFFHPQSISCHDANLEMGVLHTWQVWFEILSCHFDKILQSSYYSWSVCTMCTDSVDALSWQTYFKIKKVTPVAGSIFRPLSQTRILNVSSRTAISPDFALFSSNPSNLVGKFFLCGRS